MSLSLLTVNQPPLYKTPGDLPTAYLFFYIISMVTLISVAVFGLWQWMLGPLSEALDAPDLQAEFRSVVGVVFGLTSAFLLSQLYGRFSNVSRRAQTLLFSGRLRIKNLS